jgi:hypothetical protein
MADDGSELKGCTLNNHSPCSLTSEGLVPSLDVTEELSCSTVINVPTGTIEQVGVLKKFVGQARRIISCKLQMFMQI